MSRSRFDTSYHAADGYGWVKILGSERNGYVKYYKIWTKRVSVLTPWGG